MTQKKETLYNVVVFYDVALEKIRWEFLYNFALNFIERQGLKPTRMALDGNKVKLSGKTKSFRHYNKIIRDLSFERVDHFWIGAGYSENPGGDQDDCDIGFSADCHYGKEVFIYFRNDVLEYNTSMLKELSGPLAKASGSLYGAAFQIDQIKKDAFGYISAILSADDCQEMENNILNWDHAYNDPYGDCGTYKTGDFRDLYPLNFIGEAHLKRDVFGQTLRQWIETDSARGTLEPLNETLWTWEIPQENISALRQQLKPTDLLICFRPYE